MNARAYTMICAHLRRKMRIANSQLKALREAEDAVRHCLSAGMTPAVAWAVADNCIAVLRHETA